MTLETEAKLPLHDHAPVRAALERAGARCLRTELERNMVLDSPDESLRARGMLLRVRTTGTDEALLTIKRPAPDAGFKTREEIQTRVVDADALLRQLEALGYAVRRIYEKRRQTWALDGCEVCLDELPEIGLFVEIEGTPDAIQATAAKLGLDTNTHIGDNYLTLWDKHLAALGQQPRDMVFRGQTPER